MSDVQYRLAPGRLLFYDALQPVAANRKLLPGQVKTLTHTRAVTRALAAQVLVTQPLPPPAAPILERGTSPAGEASEPVAIPPVDPVIDGPALRYQPPYLEYRPSPAASWQTLLDTRLLTGPPGATPEFSGGADGLYYRWLYASSPNQAPSAWQRLFTLGQLQGPAGPVTEWRLAADAVQQRPLDQGPWQTVYTLGQVTGPPGPTVYFRVDTGAFQWLLRASTGEAITDWQTLFLLNSLQGPAGPVTRWRLQGGVLQYQAAPTTGWVDTFALQEVTGPAGPVTEWQTSPTHLQQRPAGSTGWLDVLPLSQLKGPTGPVTEWQMTTQYLQQRPAGASAWQNIAPLTSLTGPPGPTVYFRVEVGAFQWQLRNSDGTEITSWQTLFLLNSLQGPAGPVTEWRVTATHLQQRPAGTTAWLDVTPLTAITGPAGPGQLTYRHNSEAAGAIKLWTGSGTTNASGEVVFTWPAGLFTQIRGVWPSVVRDTATASQYIGGSWPRVITSASGQPVSVTCKVAESKTTNVVIGGGVEGLENAASGLAVNVLVIGV